MVVPQRRTVAQLQTTGARYTSASVALIQDAAHAEQRIEHNNLCRKERIKEAIELPGNGSKNMIFQDDGYFTKEKQLQAVLSDLGLDLSCTIHAIDVEYVAAVAADPGPPAVAAVPEVQETYTTRDWFNVAVNFTQTHIENHCRILNRHPDIEYPVSNSLSLVVILNNCKKELRTKIEAQLENVRTRDPECTGGALAFYFIRQAVVQASQEYAEQLQLSLKSFKLSDITAENVDEATRILRNTIATLDAAHQLPNGISKRVMNFFKTSSVESFVALFDTWSNTCIIENRFPDYNDIFERAVAVYTSMKNKGEWLPIKPANASQFNLQSDKSDSKTTSTTEDSEVEALKKELAKLKKKRGTKTRSNGNEPTETAAVAAGLSSGSPGMERIRSFHVDGTEVKGDVSPPLRSEQHVARPFHKVDGNGTIELWWCWNCGRGRGQWRNHLTYDCPGLRQPQAPTNRNDNDNQSRSQPTTPSTSGGQVTQSTPTTENARTVTFAPPTTETATMASTVQAPTLRQF